MGTKLVSTTLSIAFFAALVVNAGAQESSQVSKAAVVSTQPRFSCNVEFIEIDRQKLAQQGIDFDLREFESQSSQFSVKNTDSFRSVIASLEKKGFAEKVFAPSITISSGRTGSITAKTEDREFELFLKPDAKPNGYRADFEFRVAHPDAAHPGATRTRSLAFECEGKPEESHVMNVTKLFVGDSKSKFVLVLLTIEQRSNDASQPQ